MYTDVESYEMYNTLNIAQTCNDAGKYPECYQRMSALYCYVQGGNCYCDPLCALYNDCCEDASSQYSSGELM